MKITIATYTLLLIATFFIAVMPANTLAQQNIGEEQAINGMDSAPIFNRTTQRSRPLPWDSRFHVMTYNPYAVHHYVGMYGQAASILLDEGESVLTMNMGYSGGWMINPVQNRIYIKPIADFVENTRTHMMMITNKRVYYFTLDALEWDGDPDDPNIIWETRFVYPNSQTKSIIQYGNSGSDGPDLSDKSKYNFNYSLSGARYVAPTKVFDDGEFTYFHFEDVVEIPSIFLVLSDGSESLINFHVEGEYVVVHRVGSQFTLRSGKEVTCVFNESRPLERKLFNK